MVAPVSRERDGSRSDITRRRHEAEGCMPVARRLGGCDVGDP